MGLGKTLSIISLILRSEEYKTETEEQQGSVQMVDGFRSKLFLIFKLNEKGVLC